MKHIVALLLALFMVLPLSLVAGATTTNGISTLSAFEKQSVATDLAGSSAGEDKFSLDKYPYEEGKTVADMTIITLMEYAYNTYSSSDGRYQDYSLFLYVYNPGNVDVSKRDTRHAITMAIGSSESYKKYPLKLLSHAGDEDHDKLLLKFRVDIAAATLRELIGEKADRTYQVSEFEIAGISDTNATCHEGGKWTYSGFQAGYGSKEGTLSAEVDSMYTIWVNPTAVTYRSDEFVTEHGSSMIQLDSVYFSLPQNVVAKYGSNITDIEYQYYKYNTGWATGFYDQEAYEFFKQYEGKALTADDYMVSLYGRNNGNPLVYYGYSSDNLVLPFAIFTDTLAYVFQIPEGTSYGEFIETDIKEFCGEEWKKFCSGEESFLFADKDKHLEKHHLQNFDFTIFDGNLWDLLFGNDNAYKYKQIPGIQTVTLDSLRDVEGNLFVDSYYSDDLSVAYEKAIKANEELMVFHFASSEYLYCTEIVDTTGYEFDVDGAMVNEAIYMDFDMIKMTFEKDGKYHVLPVSMTPINVVSDIQVFNPGNDDWPPDWLVWLIVIAIIVVVIVLLVVFAPGILTAILQAIWFVLKMIVKGIVFLLRLIIKGIVALCKGIASLFQGSKKKK